MNIINMLLLLVTIIIIIILSSKQVLFYVVLMITISIFSNINIPNMGRVNTGLDQEILAPEVIMATAILDGADGGAKNG